MVEKIINNIIKKCIDELKKEHNQQLIEYEIFNPILTQFSNKIYPYVTLLFIMYALILVLIIIILFLIVFYNNKKNLFV
jgi:hypothetical protein